MKIAGCCLAAAVCLALAACAPPVDVRALVLQAREDARQGRWEPAVQGFEKALAPGSRAAADADVWVDYAEALALSRAGRLEGEPSKLVAKALAIDASNPRALDLAGSAAWEAGDFRVAAAHWQALLAQLQPGSTRHVELQAAIARAEQRARMALPRAS